MVGIPTLQCAELAGRERGTQLSGLVTGLLASLALGLAVPGCSLLFSPREAAQDAGGLPIDASADGAVADGGLELPTRLQTPDSVLATDEFGFAVAINDFGTLLAVGAPGDSTAPQTSTRDQVSSGAVYIFAKSEGQWVFSETLKSGTVAAEARFGHALDFDGDLLVVGSPGALAGQGMVEVYPVLGDDPGQPIPILRADTLAFGSAVAHRKGRLLVGAPLTGSNGAAVHFRSEAAGYAYRSAHFGASGSEVGRFVALGDFLVMGIPSSSKIRLVSPLDPISFRDQPGPAGFGTGVATTGSRIFTQDSDGVVWAHNGVTGDTQVIELPAGERAYAGLAVNSQASRIAVATRSSAGTPFGVRVLEGSAFTPRAELTSHTPDNDLGHSLDINDCGDIAAGAPATNEVVTTRIAPVLGELCPASFQ